MILTILAAGCLLLNPLQASTPNESSAAAASSITNGSYQLTPYTARYDVLRNDKKIGELTTTLSQSENGLWHYRLESNATDWLVRMLGISTLESAWFEWRDGLIIPLTYRMLSREPGRDRFWEHRYQWLSHTSSTVTHDGEYQIPIAAGTLDPLTLRIAVASRLDQNIPIDDAWSFEVLERDEVESQSIRRIGLDQIKVGQFCFDTIELYRFRREGSSRNYNAWHAPSIHALPVRILHADGDDIIEMQLVDWVFDEPNSPKPDQHGCDTA